MAGIEAGKANDTSEDEILEACLICGQGVLRQRRVNMIPSVGAMEENLSFSTIMKQTFKELISLEPTPPLYTCLICVCRVLIFDYPRQNWDFT